MNDSEMRSLLRVFVHAFRECYLDRECMRAVLLSGAKQTRVLEDWEEDYKNLSMNPPQALAVLADNLLRPLEEHLAQDSGETSLEDLLPIVQKLDSHFREWKRR